MTRRARRKKKQASRIDDSLVVTENREHYKVFASEGDNLTCKRLCLDTYSTVNIGLPQLDWGYCGVHLDDRVDVRTELVVPKKKVVGKLLRTGKILVEMERDWIIKT